MRLTSCLQVRTLRKRLPRIRRLGCGVLPRHPELFRGRQRSYCGTNNTLPLKQSLKQIEIVSQWPSTTTTTSHPNLPSKQKTASPKSPLTSPPPLPSHAGANQTTNPNPTSPPTTPTSSPNSPPSAPSPPPPTTTTQATSAKKPPANSGSASASNSSSTKTACARLAAPAVP